MDLLGFLMSTKMLLRVMLVVMVVALVMTHSRMGNGAFFASLLIVGGLVAALSRRLRRPALWLVASMALIDVFIIGQWVGLDRLVERLETTPVASTLPLDLVGGQPATAPRLDDGSLRERLEVPRLSLPLLTERPWLGHGGGTYALAFAPIKPPGYPHYWSHAHNDYVELATDVGGVGLALLLALAGATSWRAVRMLNDAEPRLKRGVGAAALMAVSCFGMHSMVDFNLQIPANAFTLVVLLALVWAMPPRASGGQGASASSLNS